MGKMAPRQISWEEYDERWLIHWIAKSGKSYRTVRGPGAASIDRVRDVCTLMAHQGRGRLREVSLEKRTFFVD